MATLSTGQITIIDYNDALSLTAYISSNKAKTQMYNPDNDTYNPDWKTSNLVLTPSLFALGTATDVIATAQVKTVEWYDVTDGKETKIATGGNYAVGTAKPVTLTVKGNVLAGLPGKDFMCKIVYHDGATNLDLTVKTDISFSRVVNGSGITDAMAWLPEGGVFKNSSVATLTAQCDLWRGSVVDTTNVSYQWYSQDPAVAEDEGGGIGWKKLADAENVVKGSTTNKMTIYSNAVAGYEVFKCVVTDADTASPTYKKTFQDTVTIADQSDPIQVTVSSSGGTIFKNGAGTTTLTARVFQAGTEIDLDGKQFSYKWYKYDSAGTLKTGWGGENVDFKTGKTLSIGGADVDTKATFEVNIEK